MGRDKALLLFEGEPLVRRAVRSLEGIFKTVLVVSSSHEVWRKAGAAWISDTYKEKGPLAGIEAALSHVGEPTFFVPCDAPFLNADFIRFQCAAWEDGLDALVAQSESGLEPLHAIWAPSVLPIIVRALREERPPSLRRVLAGLNTRTLGVEDARRFDPALRCFENWNVPEDVAANP